MFAENYHGLLERDSVLPFYAVLDHRLEYLLKNMRFFYVDLW
jgi:hypothetical protein